MHTEILLPDNAPAAYLDRSTLWNAVEKSERYKTAQLAREIEIALPVELSREQNISLVRRYIKENFVSAGMCADICLHDTGKGNPHAHVMLTMRPIEKDGTWGAKSRTEGGRKINTVDWHDRDKAEQWRRAWAAYANGALRLAGVLTDENILDHRSYERQGIEQIPTVHLGVAASQMERKGIRTERGNLNREIEFTNKQIRQLRARINHLKNWLKEETENPTPPTLADVISDILNGGEGKTRYAQIRDLKEAAKVLHFLTSNHISSLPELQEKVSDFYERQSEMSEKIKPIDRRIKTLDKHIEQSENFKKYRKVAAQYDRLNTEYETAEKATGLFAKSKAEKAREAAQDFYETNRADITLFRAAERYLKDVLQKRYEPKKLPPITKWRAERDTLNGEKGKLYQEYSALKNEIREVESIRKAAEQIARQIDPPRRTRAREMER